MKIYDKFPLIIYVDYTSIYQKSRRGGG
jgi:hypothetical protein